jgi:uncharacterized protein (TIGR04222 family)
VVDTAVQALIEGEQLRANRDHTIRVCGTDAPDEPVQQAVLAALNRVRTTNLTGARRLATTKDLVRLTSRAAADQGLLLGPGRRRAAKAAVLLPVAVFGVGVARLVNGISLGRPVAFLVVLLLATVPLLVLTAARTPRLTREGNKAVERARRPHRPDRRAFRSYGAGLTNLRVPAPVLNVAALGAAGLTDSTLRLALYGGLSSSSSGLGGYGDWTNWGAWSAGSSGGSGCGSSCGSGGGDSGGGGGGCGG